MVTKLIVLIAPVAWLIGACSYIPPTWDNRDHSIDTPSPSEISAACRNAVDGLAALTRDLDVPAHLQQEDASQRPGDFDINAYFTVLDHLAVQNGFALDYVYHYDFMGGLPVLYARSIDEKPFETYTAYANAREEESTYSYLESVVIDDTPEGYLQLVALAVMGGQFYLDWHANYNDSQIICDVAALETLLTTPNGFGNTIPEEIQQQARGIAVEPVVEYEAEIARVQVILFTKWGGFSRATFTIGRGFPRGSIEIEETTLVPYDCGVMF